MKTRASYRSYHGPQTYTEEVRLCVGVQDSAIDPTGVLGGADGLGVLF